MRPIGAHMSIAGGIVKAVDRAQKAGATALQIFTRNQVQWAIPELSEDTVTAFRSQMAASRLRFTCVHASYLINLASATLVTRRRSLDALTVELERAEALGCACVIIHPGSPGNDGRETGFERIAAAVRQVLERTAGMHVRLALENTAGQGRMLGGPLADLGRMISDAGGDARLAVCLDTAHAFAAGYDIRESAGMERLAGDLERHVGRERLMVLHLNDSLHECGSRRDRHTHIGEGRIGTAGFRRLLQHPLTGDVAGVIETPKEDGNPVHDKRNIARLRQLQLDYGS